MDNRRRRTRVKFETTADVQTRGARIKDQETLDLSLKGVFLKGKHPLEKGWKCTVTVHLQGGEGDSRDLFMEGEVARLTPEGTAIDFVSMDPETYMHLRNLVLLNAEDPDKAEHEFGSPAFDASSEKD